MRRSHATVKFRELLLFFFSSRRRHTRFDCDWSSDVCSSDLESIASMLDVNVTGLLLATKAAVPLFPPEGGSIINIGSVASEFAPATASVYKIGRASCRERV